MPDPTILAVESLLDAAMRTLLRASRRAESLRDQGLCDDIYQLASELARVVNSLSS